MGALDADGRLAWALRLTLLALVLDGSLYWFQRVPVTIVAGLALVVPGLPHARWIWALLLAAVSWPLLWNWPFSDNHDYLRAIWCLAVLACLGLPDAARALQRNARWLLGGVFLFGTLWKLVLSPDFVDGSFFRVALLTDGRFHELARLAGGVDLATLDAFDAAVRAALGGEAGAPASGFVEPPALRRLALALTGFTLLLEGAIAVAFLLPDRFRLSRLRDAGLLLFAVSTYAFATVRGFGWLLMAMGVAQAGSARLRWAYVGVFFLIEAYRSVPFRRALVDGLGLG